MSSFFWTLISRIWLWLLSLRYTIEVKGLEKLFRKKFSGGLLFLPNHSAHMDPLFLFLLLWPTYRMRPLVVEHIYRLSFLKPLMKLIRAVSVPNFELSASQLKVRRAEESMQEIVAGLKRGENFIIYPGGRLKTSAKEILGGASSAHAFIQEFPEVNVVLIRTTGLWGSTFSCAEQGHTPELFSALLRGIKTVLKNLLFFCPRRKVLIEIETEVPDLPRKASRLELNRFLEQWYNRYPDEEGKIHEEEPLKLVSYSFWRKELLQIYQPKKKKIERSSAISDKTKEKIYAEIRKILENPGMEITPQMHLATDLGMDSLNIAEMVAYLAQHYNLGELHPEDVDTVQKILEIAEGSHKLEHLVHGATYRWPEEKERPHPFIPRGKTFPEAFLFACQQMGNSIACGDDLSGVLSYKKVKRMILVLASYLRQIPDARVAVMLPASVGAYLIVLALQFAGKTPVMLNWTLGPRYLDDMMSLSGAKICLSSWKFLDRLSHVEFGKLIDQLQVMEEIREKIPLKTKLKGALLSLCPDWMVLRALDLHRVKEEDSAVVLFTSGTEASPKGVPLSHKNILANLSSAIRCLDLRSDDVMYGALPPFHSFGFSVAGLISFFAGLKIAFYPDPTDSFALAEGIKRWQITLFCAPPGFLKGLLQAAKKEQITSVRYFVTGAEKASQELYERIEKLKTGARLLEGYGITECSPIITMTRLNVSPKGVGAPLPDQEICTIHPETLALLPAGSEGEICVRGPNVFAGYLGHPRDPFIQLEGKKWYRTGDLGFLDKEGNLHISGRLKRFTKIGGEMISLGAIEGALVQEMIRRGEITSDDHALAICAEEKEEGKPHIVLFTTISLQKEEANEILRQSGLSRLVKISAVKQIEEIPLLGTGKTDYRKLQTMIA